MTLAVAAAFLAVRATNTFLTAFLCPINIPSGKPYNGKDHPDDNVVSHTATLTFLLAVVARYVMAMTIPKTISPPPIKPLPRLPVVMSVPI